jgi:hypothetical protein
MIDKHNYGVFFLKYSTPFFLRLDIDHTIYNTNIAVHHWSFLNIAFLCLHSGRYRYKGNRYVVMNYMILFHDKLSSFNEHTHLNVLYITICNRRQYFTFEQKSRFPPLLNVTKRTISFRTFKKMKNYVFLFKYNPIYWNDFT